MFKLKCFQKFFRKSLVSTPVLILFLESCANTPIGQQLSESFDAPSEMPLVKDASLDSPSSNTSKVVRKIDLKTKENIDQVQKDRKKVSQIKQKKEIKPMIIPFNPSPYRITIKLSEANPSAPAEGVTKALRNAGISFEVERIERVSFSKK